MVFFICKQKREGKGKQKRKELKVSQTAIVYFVCIMKPFQCIYRPMSDPEYSKDPKETDSQRDKQGFVVSSHQTNATSIRTL
jgi:hypothetical protein